MKKYKNHSKSELLEIYRLMFLSRKLDEKQLILLKQGKGFFHIGASGHEAAQVAAANSMDPSLDYAYPYYRNQAFCLAYGMTSKDMLLSFLAKEDDPNSGGRQMPQHFGCKELNIVSQSSPTGTQYLQATGAAFALQRNGDNGVVYVSSGEGTTSQGDFHEALNWSSRTKAPVVFHVENNGYAISVPINEQTAGSSIYKITAGYENLLRIQIDGTDYFESMLAFNKAVDRARKGHGPTVVESHVVRLLPHSSSDDHRKYRSEEEILSDIKNDPIEKFKTLCIEQKIASLKDFDKIEETILDEINDDANWAEKQADPDDALKNLFVEENIFDDSLNETDNQVVLVDAINHAMDEELKYNDKLVVYGQDVAGGKGGVFTATKELTSKHGEDRVFNSPLAESSIIGTAIGMATLGYKPVVEIQFGDYIWTSMMQIRNELATMNYRSNGQWNCPVVVRVPVGGYIHGSLCHSQSIDGYFTHLPGIKIAYPSNASDAKGLLKAACRMNNPVLFFEHKGLYRQNFATSKEPDDNYCLNFGNGSIVQEGEDLTIITWGALVQKSIEASKKTEHSIEILDLRTLNPLDLDLIISSISKTNRALIVYEDNLTGGFGAEISSLINEHGFKLLDAPVKRVASKDVPVAYSSALEDQILVQTEWIIDAINELVEF
ncbi:MAG: tungsten formylmethanofuran dehydrogenase [Candidatus Marinimicrobia bacterium]|nr:tungsten formylmethanofuran dehydrogenase [Candidatus Neomarinimicrobiota bacterium]